MNNWHLTIKNNVRRTIVYDKKNRSPVKKEERFFGYSALIIRL